MSDNNIPVQVIVATFAGTIGDVSAASSSPTTDPGPLPAETSAPVDKQLTRLKMLGDLHPSGVLTDQEFEREK